ncbi:DUF1456 family protein [Thalassotalea fusca]
MTNNDVIRRIRYTLNLKDKQIQTIFAHVERLVTFEQIQSWLLKDEDENFAAITDENLAHFLNGLIIEKRGKKDDVIPVAEKTLNNNLVLLKLKIAFNLQAEDIINLLKKAEFTISKPELSAFFRKPEHKHFRQCKAQFLRKFLMALQLTYRPSTGNSGNQKTAQPKYKPKHEKKAATPKQVYVNPKAQQTKQENTSTRKVLKLKPNQIWKDHQ